MFLLELDTWGKVPLPVPAETFPRFLVPIDLELFSCHRVLQGGTEGFAVIFAVLQTFFNAAG